MKMIDCGKRRTKKLTTRKKRNKVEEAPCYMSYYCVICQETFAPNHEDGHDCCQECGDTDNVNDDSRFTLECQHTFHTKCLMSWFRSQNEGCPLCRDGAHVRLSHMTAETRVRMLRRCARRKNADPKLKKLVMRLRTLEEKHKSAISAYASFRRNHRHVLMQLKLMDRKKWMIWKKIRAETRALAMFNSDMHTYPMFELMRAG